MTDPTQPSKDFLRSLRDSATLVSQEELDKRCEAIREATPSMEQTLVTLTAGSAAIKQAGISLSDATDEEIEEIRKGILALVEPEAETDE